MKLSELKTGMIVTLRNGNEYVVFRDSVNYSLYYNKTDFVFVNGKGGWIDAKSYDENMKYLRDKNYDVVKVELSSHPYGFMDINYCKADRATIWMENEGFKEITIADIEKIFGCKVKIVKED